MQQLKTSANKNGAVMLRYHIDGNVLVCSQHRKVPHHSELHSEGSGELGTLLENHESDFKALSLKTF